jgi:hypothetical protein
MSDQVPTAIYAVRMDRSKLDRLKEIAAREHRTLAGEFRRLADERIALDDEQQQRETA